MKKTFIAILLLSSSLLLVGCGKTDTTAASSDTGTSTIVASSTETSTASGSTESEFTIPACNKYVDIMKCVVTKSPEQSKEQVKKSFDQVIALWKTLTEEQVVSLCDQNMKALEEQKSVIEGMGCAWN